MTHDMPRIMAQENLICQSGPTRKQSLCLSKETRLLALENRLRQTEEALVAERRASPRNAEVAQQVVRACPAGVDVEEQHGLEMFSGDSDLNGRVSSMPWSVEKQRKGSRGTVGRRGPLMYWWSTKASRTRCAATSPSQTTSKRTL